MPQHGADSSGVPRCNCLYRRGVGAHRTLVARRSFGSYGGQEIELEDAPYLKEPLTAALTSVHLRFDPGDRRFDFARLLNLSTAALHTVAPELDLVRYAGDPAARVTCLASDWGDPAGGRRGGGCHPRRGCPGFTVVVK